MFKPLQMMITKTMNPSMSTSRGTHSTVNRDDDDDDSSSPGFNYSSPESDDDGHIVSKVVDKSCYEHVVYPYIRKTRINRQTRLDDSF